MNTHVRKATPVHAGQWFPPDDSRHDPVATPITCPRELAQRDGTPLGAVLISTDASAYFVRLQEHILEQLEPGDWIVKMSGWHSDFIKVLKPDVFTELYEPLSEERPRIPDSAVCFWQQDGAWHAAHKDHKPGGPIGKGADIEVALRALQVNNVLRTPGDLR